MIIIITITIIAITISTKSHYYGEPEKFQEENKEETQEEGARGGEEGETLWTY